MTSVYLGGLPDSIGREELLRHLSTYGRVDALSMQKGYSFVEYESNADARDFVTSFQSQPFMGYDVKVELARKPRRQNTTSSTLSSETGRSRPRSRIEGGRVRYPVVVNNLNPRTCWQELKDFGRLAGGTIAFCDIDRNNRNRGFLEYYTQEDADRFVRELNGKTLLGNVISLHGHGRKVLLPEHGPRSRSPTHRRRRSSASVSAISPRECSHSHSRSQSPLSAHRRDFKQAQHFPYDSPMLLPTSSRYDKYRSDCDDQSINPREPHQSPRRVPYEQTRGTRKTAQVSEIESGTAYPTFSDYIDAMDKHRARIERTVAAQWEEYKETPLGPHC